MVIEQILQDFSILFHEIINNLPSQLPDFNVPITYGIPNVTTECMKDLLTVVPTSTNISTWTANQTAIFTPMLDASGKVSPGILRGNTKLVGLYSECAAINAQVEKDRWIIGGYGRLFIDASFRDYRDPSSSCHTTSMIFQGWTLDLCVPLRCSDSTNLLAIGRALSVNGSVPVCRALSIIEQGRKKDYRTWIVVAVMGLVGVATFAGTIYDYFLDSDFKARYAHTKWAQCLVAFSFYANVCQIMAMDDKKPGQIGSIHFMRFISLCWVVLGHVCMMNVVVDGKCGPDFLTSRNMNKFICFM
ncbi:unnamed protein product [Enterobius vermicularis]|uniref:NRF domain-containing protein n=1 Tax=Enterobius vermicularis TaxID=51028 RepID=A0A0N4USS5_ENTVE|nr:unnamed protein product [Enterobius vermicularis]